MREKMLILKEGNNRGFTKVADVANKGLHRKTVLTRHALDSRSINLMFSHAPLQFLDFLDHFRNQ